MDEQLNRLALALGRPLPRPVGWLSRGVWGIGFIAMMASVTVGLPRPFPAPEVVMAAFVAVTIVGLLRHQAVIRRRELIRLQEPPLQASEGDIQRWLKAKPRPVLAFTLFGLIAFGMMASVWFRIEAEENRIAEKCAVYAGSIGARPNQVVSCPYR